MQIELHGMAAEASRHYKPTWIKEAREQQAEQFAIGQQKELGLAGLQTGLTGAEATGTMAARTQVADLERLKAQAVSCR